MPIERWKYCPFSFARPNDDSSPFLCPKESEKRWRNPNQDSTLRDHDTLSASVVFDSLTSGVLSPHRHPEGLQRFDLSEVEGCLARPTTNCTQSNTIEPGLNTPSPSREVPLDQSISQMHLSHPGRLRRPPLSPGACSQIEGNPALLNGFSSGNAV